MILKIKLKKNKMENIIKIQIVYTLLIGISIAIFTFLGNFISDKIKSHSKISKLFLLIFIIGTLFIFFVSMIILFNPSLDLHSIGDFFRLK
jgi:hypothetical protein